MTKKRIPWDTIRLRYVTGVDKPSYRDLAVEFGVSYNAIYAKSKKGGWLKARDTHRDKVASEVGQKIIDEQAGEETRLVGDLKKIRDILIQQIAPKSIQRDPKTNRVTGFDFNNEIKSYETLGRLLLDICKYIDAHEGRVAERIEVITPDKERMTSFLIRLKEKEPDMYEEFRQIVEDGTPKPHCKQS